MEWTDFDSDDQTTLALRSGIRHGRAAPLARPTARWDALKDSGGDVEDFGHRRLTTIASPSLQIAIDGREPWRAI